MINPKSSDYYLNANSLKFCLLAIYFKIPVDCDIIVNNEFLKQTKGESI